MIIATVFGINPNKSSAGQLGSVVYPASLTSLASGCGDFNVWNNLKAKDQYAVIPASERESLTAIPTHQMIVPVYGYMNSDTCLLYTSPSPRDRQKSRMPSSA